MHKKREKVEERTIFSLSEKEEMLKKSKYKCAHCGKKIAINNEFTVEHIVPISLGGDNNIANLIALCYDCNMKKGNLIIQPKEYYKYLNSKDLKTAQQYFDEYIHKFNWLTRTNVLPYDMFNVQYYILRPINGNLSKVRNIVTIKRAVHNKYKSDFDRIYEFCDAYNTEYNVDCHGEDLEKAIEKMFNMGCLYYTEINDSIKAIFPVCFTNIVYEDNPGRYHYMLYFRNPLTLKDNYTYADMVLNVYDYIFDQIAAICSDSNVPIMTVGFEVNDNLKYIKEAILLAHGFDDEDENAYREYMQRKHQNIMTSNKPDDKSKCEFNDYISNYVTSKRFKSMTEYECSNDDLNRFDRFVQKHIKDLTIR